MKRIIILTLFIIILFSPIIAHAHGAKIEYNANMSYELLAKYDSGEPMANAQIIVYAPDDPATPWTKGAADENGRYSFVPDFSKKGMWTIQARYAGHGANINIEIGEEASLAGSTGYTWLQKLIMAASVVWGMIGTALFYTRRKN
ncbi:MAG: hypothetical protein JM58_14400 [Peptococcaceae bacterium BICA1-8]|nr:MAG: hypothetical protein JM58_14400 [Peptococcaceae bacterium BICA1-8]